MASQGQKFNSYYNELKQRKLNNNTFPKFMLSFFNHTFFIWLILFIVVIIKIWIKTKMN